MPSKSGILWTLVTNTEDFAGYLDYTFSHNFYSAGWYWWWRGEAESPMTDFFEDYSLLRFPSGGRISSGVSCRRLSTVAWLITLPKLSKEPCCAAESHQLEQSDLSYKSQELFTMSSQNQLTVCSSCGWLSRDWSAVKTALLITHGEKWNHLKCFA